MRCTKCGRELTVWDEGYFKKMVNRGATECCCIPCTAAHFGLTEEKAWEMIRRFQKTGCTLFPAAGDSEKENLDSLLSF